MKTRRGLIVCPAKLWAVQEGGGSKAAFEHFTREASTWSAAARGQLFWWLTKGHREMTGVSPFQVAGWPDTLLHHWRAPLPYLLCQRGGVLSSGP